MKNRYVKKSRISEVQFRHFLKIFSLDLEATKIAEITKLNRNTVNRFIKLIRLRIAEHCEKSSPFKGEIEADESYFGPKRTKGKRGRGAGSKTIVFGLLKRNGKVYTEIVPDCSKPTLQRVIKGVVSVDSIIHTDGWRGYNGLVDMGYKKHFRVNHDKNEFANHRSHINGIENFWGIAKARLIKYRGIKKANFYFHLKESEFRFNYRKKNVYKTLLSIIRNHPLS